MRQNEAWRQFIASVGGCKSCLLNIAMSSQALGPFKNYVNKQGGGLVKCRHNYIIYIRLTRITHYGLYTNYVDRILRIFDPILPRSVCMTPYLTRKLYQHCNIL